MRKLNCLLLEGTGIFGKLIEAADGKEALAKAATFEPDLILLDLLMPEMDGFEALPRLRTMCPRAKIVALSMLKQESVPGRVLSLGADLFIDKGEDGARIAARLVEMFSQKPPSVVRVPPESPDESSRDPRSQNPRPRPRRGQPPDDGAGSRLIWSCSGFLVGFPLAGWRGSAGFGNGWARASPPIHVRFPAGQ